MTKKEYDDLIIQDNVFSEELLDNLIKIVNKEGVVRALGLVRPHMTYDRTANNENVGKTHVPPPKLKEFPIPQPEESMSKQKYYKLCLIKEEVGILLHVIQIAQTTKDKKTTDQPDMLLFLETKLQKYYDSFG